MSLTVHNKDHHIYFRMANILCDQFIEMYIQSGFYTSENIIHCGNHLNLKLCYRLSSPHTQQRQETVN